MLANGPAVAAADVPVFHKEKHITYWLRCLRTPLPTAYTSIDSNRMTFAYFIVSALDLLGVLFTRTSSTERDAYVDWVYSCQHPHGGFQGSPPYCPSNSDDSHTQRHFDAATLPATFFALATLSVLGHDLRHVKRKQCLQWLCRMQRPDGSFGELLSEHGQVLGGMDTRFAHFATGVRWILRGDLEGPVDGVPDIEVDKLVGCIRQSETYDGGISEEPFHEAHAGFTYCALCALAFVGRMPETKRGVTASRPANEISSKPLGLSSPERTVRWLMARLTTNIEEDDFDDRGESNNHEEPVLPGLKPHMPNINPASDSERVERSFIKIRNLSHSHDKKSDTAHSMSMALPDAAPVHWTGFNGRCNKVADTCYAWWVGASLEMLNGLDFVDIHQVRCYLLEKTQHLVAGGFGKFPSDPPDIYHAYLGLAALALIDGHKAAGAVIGPDVEDAKSKVTGSDNDTATAGIKRKESNENERILRTLDPALSFSSSAKKWVESFGWRKMRELSTAR